VLSKLSAGTFAAVWREMFVPSLDAVRVCERRGAVYAVTPPSYPTDTNVAALVEGVAGLFDDPVPCLLRYAAATSSVDLLLGLRDFKVRVTASDVYDGDGVRIEVVTKEGESLGDPLPQVKKRRREGGGVSTVVEGIAVKIRAAPKFYKGRTT
jgi:hypothetical protein